MVWAVLQVIQQGELRGAEVFALDLSRALARRGACGVSLASLFGVEDAYQEAASLAGIDIAILQPAGRARGFDVRLAQSLRARIDEGRYEIVQANGAATLKYLVAVRRLSRRPWKLVYRAIGVGSFWRRGRGRRLLYRWLFAQPDRIIAVSQAVADDLVGATGVDPRKVLVIANGVDPARIQSAPDDRRHIRQTLGVAPHEVLILYTGSLAPEKNLRALVRVVRDCRRRGAAVKAVLVGDGPCRDELATDVRASGVEDAVVLFRGQPRIGPFLAAADVCVLPSLSEGMPAFLIEAGLAGRPVAAYAVGGIPEVVAHGVTGMLVPSGDEDGLASAVAGLCADPRRRAAMGEAARAHCRRFEIGPVTEAYCQAYSEILNRSGHH